MPVIKNLSTIELTSRVCFLVGENGSGKSTFLEAIAENFGIGGEGGSKHISSAGGTKQHDDQTLAGNLRLSWSRKLLHGYFLRAESFFNIASYIDESDPEILAAYGGTRLHEQSHGESFLALMQHRFGADGFYLLDEPEAALSPQRQLSVLVVWHQLLSRTSRTQFLIATHSPILLAYPGAQILSFDGDRISEIGYRETAAYEVMSAFLADPERYLHHLFGASPGE